MTTNWPTRFSDHIGSWITCMLFIIAGGQHSFAEARDSKAETGGRTSAGIAVQTGTAASLKPAKHLITAETSTPATCPILEPNPLPLCFGLGERVTFLETDWESGVLDPWTAATHDIVNPSTFSTPDWAVVPDLPDSRPGQAAYVANVNTGDCDPDIGPDDESGALNLDSPAILIPGGTLVPRIAVNHWVATEADFDGGNFKYSKNGGPWTLVPRSAMDLSPYNGTLLPADNIPPNSNPLAGEPAFTGADDDATGSWGQSLINLYGIAQAGDTIRLRFDFGIDRCDGLIGWYVDEVVAYSCVDELPPSDCGNGVIDDLEECDDGDTFNGDGCSNSCQVEDGWECAAPTPAGEIGDPGFEAGTPNPDWTEASINFDSPICNGTICKNISGAGPASGDWWAWFGGIEAYEEGSLSQVVTVPSTVTHLTFELEANACDSAADYLEVLVDGARVFNVDGSSPSCGKCGYQTQAADISAFADDGSHTLEFRTETFANNLGVSNFLVDDIRMPGTPSSCTPVQELPTLTIVKKVINDNGGAATADEFEISTSAGVLVFGPGVGANPTVYTATTLTELQPGVSYSLLESDLDAYTEGDWTCGVNGGGGPFNGGSITLASGENASCEITNNDRAPSLTLIKQVVNDSGGTAVPGDWTLSAVGFDPGNPVAGTYPLSESGPPGYIRTSLTCDNAIGQVDSVTLGPGEVVSCTFVNDDVATEEVILEDGFEARQTESS